MELLERLQYFALADGLALATLFTCWFAISWLVENPPKRNPSVMVLMGNYRSEWFINCITREPRIFDGNILATLREGITFFASASMIAIGGALALMGNTESLLGVAQDLTLKSTPALIWEIKLLVVLMFIANGFLKFVWAHRLFGYCAVVMASIPNDPADPKAHPRAMQAAEINITASRSFNRGMRSIYFALAAMAWMLGALALAGAALFTLLVVWRREFASRSRTILLQDPPSGGAS
ncbi:MAG: DUF599 domain-containing protein [Halocynthiibacter sp.]